jgi:hypothetical protein
MAFFPVYITNNQVLFFVIVLECFIFAPQKYIFTSQELRDTSALVATFPQTINNLQTAALKQHRIQMKNCYSSVGLWQWCIIFGIIHALDFSITHKIKIKPLSDTGRKN